MLFCITGHVGAGKTSVLKELRSRGVFVLTEPIDEWAQVLRAVDNNVPYAQIVLQTMVAQWYGSVARDQQEGRLPKVAFIERSPTCGLAFARALENSYPSFSEIVDLLHKQMAHLNIDQYFNLKVPFEGLVERVVTRGQPGDTKWMAPDAFVQHERLLLEVWPMEEIEKVTDIDGTATVEEVADAILSYLPSGLLENPQIMF